MARSRLLLVGAIAGALALVGCSSGATDQRAGKPAEKRWSLQYAAASPVRLARSVLLADVSDDTALLAYTDKDGVAEDTIGSFELSTGKRTVLARTGYPGGSIVGVVHAGREIVYLDESNPGPLTPGASKWRVIVLRTHRVLASSERRVTMPPDLTAIDGAAVWTVYPDEGGRSMLAYGWTPGGKVKRRDALPGDEHECTPNASAEEVVGCDERSGWIVWEVKAAPLEPAGEDNPVSVFAARSGGGKRHKLGEVYDDSSSGPVLFGDYVFWEDAAGFKITSLSHLSATVVALPHGDSYRYAQRTSDDRIAITVGTDDATTLQLIDTKQLHLTSE